MRGRLHVKIAQHKISSQYAIVIEIENNAYGYRCSLESINSKLTVDELRSGFELLFDSVISCTNSFSGNATVPTPPPKRAKLNSAQNKCMECQAATMSIKSLNPQQTQIIAYQP